MRKLLYYSTKAYPVLLCLISMFIFFEFWYVKIPDIRINGMTGGLSLKRLFFNLDNLSTLYQRNHQHFEVYFTVGIVAEIIIIIGFIMYFQKSKQNELHGKMFK